MLTSINRDRGDEVVYQPPCFFGGNVNKEQKKLYRDFMATPLATSKHLSGESMFYAGCLAVRQEIERFIDDKLCGERGDAFSLGQDDGLRWVKDHLQFLFDKDF